MIKNIVPQLVFLTIFLLICNTTQSSEQNWDHAKKGDKIILIRHALAPGRGDPKGFKINDCKTQRNLDQTGINQSKKIGKLFREKKIKIDQVFTSQWCRCKDTARYAFKNYKEFSALNSTFSPPFDKKEKQQIKELNNFVQKWEGKGGNLILVTHYVVILAMTGIALCSGELVITDRNFNVLSTIKTF